MFPTLWRATADTQCSMLSNGGGRRRAPRARVVAALVLQRGRHERRQRQRRMMGVGAVVKRFELLGARIDLAEVEVARLLRQRAAPPAGRVARLREGQRRSEEHTSELQSLMRISYAVFCLKNKKQLKH